MRQVIQDVRSGATTVMEIPAPLAVPGHVLVATVTSAISAGTERYVVDLARKSLIGRARQRPEDAMHADFCVPARARLTLLSNSGGSPSAQTRWNRSRDDLPEALFGRLHVVGEVWVACWTPVAILG